MVISLCWFINANYRAGNLSLHVFHSPLFKAMHEIYGLKIWKSLFVEFFSKKGSVFLDQIPQQS